MNNYVLLPHPNPKVFYRGEPGFVVIILDLFQVVKIRDEVGMFVVTVQSPLGKIDFGWGVEVLYNKELRDKTQSVVQYMTPPLDAPLKKVTPAVRSTKCKQGVDLQTGTCLHYQACHNCSLRHSKNADFFASEIRVIV